MSWELAKASYKNNYEKYKREMIDSRIDEVQHLLPGFYVICERVKIPTGKVAIYDKT